MSGINHYDQKLRREMRRKFHEEKDVPKRLRKLKNKEIYIDPDYGYEYGYEDL